MNSEQIENANKKLIEQQAELVRKMQHADIEVQSIGAL